MYCENPYGLNLESDCGDLVNQSLVLDGEKGELVKASGRIGKRIGVSETKTIAALKSHSEAERRRRERINAHLATLRGLVPNNEKVSGCSWLAFNAYTIQVCYECDHLVLKIFQSKTLFYSRNVNSIVYSIKLMNWWC